MGRGMATSVFAKNDSPADVNDRRAQGLPRFMGQNRDKNVQMVRKFQALSEKKGCNVSQLALAWLLKQGEDIIPNPGTKRIEYLEDNWKAMQIQLTDDEEKEVRAFVEKAETAGHQMPPGMEEMQFEDTVEES